MIPKHKCNGFTQGEPWQEGRDCYLCWSAANSPKWQEFFSTWRPKLRLPRFMRRVKTFTKTVIHALLHGLPWVTPEVYAEREAKCTPCYYRTKDGKCSKCGCGTANRGRSWLLDKLWWALESCPDGQWPAVEGETVFARAKRWIKERLSGWTAHETNFPGPCDCPPSEVKE